MVRATLLVLAMAQVAYAQDPVDAVLDAIADLDAAAHQLKDPSENQDPISALTASVQAYETGLAALREAGRRAALARLSAEQDFDARSGDLSRLLAAMQSAGAPTSAGRLLHPSGPLGSVRAATLLSDVVPALQAHAKAAETRLQEVDRLQTAIEAAQSALLTGANGARDARLALAEASRKRQTPLGDDIAVVNALAQAGTSLEDLALALVEAPATGRITDERADPIAAGDLPLPVRGALLSGYDPGSTRPGLRIATLPFALVTSPIPASVRFSGLLTGYGNVIILEPKTGYLLILAGVHEPFVATGEVLPPGAALGLMGGTEENRQAPQFERAPMLTETLYVEARADGDTVDPATWFALDKER